MANDGDNTEHLIGETPRTTIEKHINDLKHSGGIHTNFEYWCRDWVIQELNFSPDEISGMVIAGSGEIGVDSYILHPPSNTVVLIQSKWHITDNKEATTLISHLRGCMSILGDSAASSEISKNQKRIDMDAAIMEFANTLDKKTDLKVKIILASNWDLKDTAAAMAENTVPLGKQVDGVPEYGWAESIEHWGPEKIDEHYRIEAGKAIKPILNDDRELSGNFLIADTDESLMIGYIQGDDLRKFMMAANKTKDLKLLSANVRMRKAVGKECTAASTDSAERIAFRIRDCLLRESELFARRNNGLQIVADDFEYLGSYTKGDPHYNGKLKLINPSLSNGGQTAQEVFDCSPSELKDVRIVVKIIKCVDPGERTQNAISSNQQNATTPRNFRANDDDMQLLKEHFSTLEPKMFLEIKENEWKNRLANGEDMDAQYPAGNLDNTFTGQLIWAWYGGWGFPSANKQDQWHTKLTLDLYDLNVENVVATGNFPIGTKLGIQKDLNINEKNENYSTVSILTHFLFNLFSQVRNKRMKKANLWKTGDGTRDKITEKNLFVTSGSFAFIGLVNYVRMKHGCSEKEILETFLGKGFQGKDWSKWIVNGGSEFDDIVGPVNSDKGNHKIIDPEHEPNNPNFHNAQKWVSNLYTCMFNAATEWRKSNDQSSASLYHSNNYSFYIECCTNEIDKIFDDGEKNDKFPLKSSAKAVAPTVIASTSSTSNSGVTEHLENAKYRISVWIKALKDGKDEDKIKGYMKKNIEDVWLVLEHEESLYELLKESVDLLTKIDFEGLLGDPPKKDVEKISPASEDIKDEVVHSEDETKSSGEILISGDKETSEIHASAPSVFDPNEDLV